MFLGSSLNVKAKLLLGLLICAGLQTVWANTPYSTQEMRSAERGNESQIRALRNEEIQQLRVALGRRQPTNRRADLYFRLAEIYLEAYRSEFILEGRVHESRIEKGIQDSLLDRSQSRPYISSGIKACLEILGYHIRYEKMDRIYYFLGFYYGELDQRKEGVEYYRKLIREFPQSVFVGVAHKEVGDYEYQTADYHKAIGDLESALHLIKEDLAPGILHKLAWCYYRTKQFDRAISTMKDVIAKCNADSAKYLPLKDESLRDMAVLMTESGKVTEAIEYFETQAGDKTLYPKLLEKLGRQYERNVEFSKAEKVYDTLIKTSPESDSALKSLEKLVELDIKQGRYKELIHRLRSFPLSEGKSQDAQSAVRNIRVAVRKVAVDHHQMYRAKKNPSDIEIAQEFYETYLDLFLKKEDPHHEVPEIQMYLAEISKDLGKNQEAAGYYKKVIESKDAKYAKSAGALWAGSLADSLKKIPPRAGADEPSQLEKEFVIASDELRKAQGDIPEARDNALRIAQVLAGYKNSRVDAVRRIQEIVGLWPKSHQATVAAQLWIQIYQDYPHQTDLPDNLGTVLKAIRSNSELLAADHQLNQSKIQANLDQLEVKEKVETISKHEKDKDFAAAAQGYEEFASGTQDRAIVEKSYTNAISSYLKVENSRESLLRVIELWMHRYPASPKAVEPIRMIATNALIQGEFEFSAQMFQKLGSDFHDADSLDTAARLYQGVGDAHHADLLWRQFIDLHKTSPRREEIELELARALEKSNEDGEASRSYRVCSGGSSFIASECAARLADLYIKNQDVAKAKEIFHSIAAQGGGQEDSQKNGQKNSKKNSSKKNNKKSKGAATANASPFVGYARYKLAEMMENEAAFEPMRFPEAQLKKGLNQRLNFLEPLSKAYQSAVQVGGPWGIAALHRLALWATHFADEVDEIEAPSTLQGPALERFKNQLKSVSVPLREKARSTWSDAYSKAVSLNLLSPALPEVADHLADFRSGSPGRAQGSRGKFYLSGIPAQSEPENGIGNLKKVRDSLLKDARDAAAWTDYGNLLWGQGKPLLSKIAYQRALSLKSRSPVALNNLAVVKLSSEGEEDWISAAQSAGYLEEALKSDDFFVPAKMNLASLMNYYRLFPRSKTLWDQIRVRNTSIDSDFGLAIALQGLGKQDAAEQLFKKAAEKGDKTPSSLFIENYHQAGRESLKGISGAEDCSDSLKKIDEKLLEGFEKSSVEYLLRKCELWKKKE